MKFTKMQGAGNDFIVLDCTRTAFSLTSAQLTKLADRRLGVGCDQFLIVEAPSSTSFDFNYRIFNADGGEVEHCGNGARAFVRFVRSKGLTDKREIRVNTMAGALRLIETAQGGITVDMGVPKHSAADIPFVSDTPEATIHTLDVGGVQREITVVNFGNPHAVQFVADVARAPVCTEGPQVEHHPRFPNRVNVGYAQVVSVHAIRLRVWERGVGETLACGTGACAAVVAGIERGLLQSPVRVHASGGDLEIEWAGRGHTARLTGPAEIVFEGEATL